MIKRGEKLYQRVATAIASSIESGTYPRASRLPAERDLAIEFNVSRPTIREAMIALEIRGLVQARHGSSLYVSAALQEAASIAELDVGAFELVEARMLFEGEGAALAATSIDDDRLALLEEALATMRDADPSSDAAMAADRCFHLLVAEATGNGLICNVVETLWDVRERSPLCVDMFARARREGINPRVDEHRMIVDALRARAPGAARQAMHNHLQQVTADLLSATEVELIERTRSEIQAHRDRVARRVSLRPA